MSRAPSAPLPVFCTPILMTDGGPATSARLNNPRAVVVNSDLSWFIAGEAYCECRSLFCFWNPVLFSDSFSSLRGAHSFLCPCHTDTANHRIRRVGNTSPYSIAVCLCEFRHLHMHAYLSNCARTIFNASSIWHTRPT